MLLQSLRVLCKSPGGWENIWKYLAALARASGVSERFGYGLRTHLHFADDTEFVSPLPCSLALCIGHLSVPW
jgi:hypothetical protein